jgi:Icc-related predicted phosphoesterase
VTVGLLERRRRAREGSGARGEQRPVRGPAGTASGKGGRPAEGSAGAGAQARVYYASDIHGTEGLWRKFLNAAEIYHAGVIVMGGDVAGKVVVPLLERPEGYELELFGRRELLVGAEQAQDAERRIRANGMYPHRMSTAEALRVAALPEEQRERWFAQVMMETFERWLALADGRLQDSAVRCFLMPGNDDPPGIEEAVARARHVEACDERIVEFGGYEMVSLGYSNRTPFASPRELDEDELYRRVEQLVAQLREPGRAIFNLHVPPYDSTLDTAAELDEHLSVVRIGSEPKLIPVGSTAVRELIERYQPLVSLHGHVHESPGAMRIGRTLCINPGSAYHTGRIAGCLINLKGERARHQFVTG